MSLAHWKCNFNTMWTLCEDRNSMEHQCALQKPNQTRKHRPLGPISTGFGAYLILTNKDVNLIFSDEARVTCRSQECQPHTRNNAVVSLVEFRSPYLNCHTFLLDCCSSYQNSVSNSEQRSNYEPHEGRTWSLF